ncbi:MAG TPA: hypothetical protein VHU87_13745, partial [Rhizomicrobium sp.]|nr:hypothetical protein [Rhizomicrobium sp.]
TFAQTQGTSDKRVTNNVALLAEIEAGRAPHAYAPVPVKPQQMAVAPVRTMTPVAVAALPAPSKPMMSQHAANAATGAPHSMAAATTSPASNPRVVMEAVPKDPLAGPVKPRVTVRRTRVAKAQKKPMPAPPALRTAADTH